jgi:2-polyprenyl-6-methoxyphenol hydroxylase-like FAD-dependent oxidoreductase
MRAVIVGGGIGGLAAAIGLRRVGFETVVLERAQRLESVGAGLTLAANAVRAIERLGIADEVRRMAARGRELLVGTSAGHPLLRSDLDAFETLGVHRADLQRVLLEHAGDVRLGEEVSDVRAVEADLIVGADGINSAVRAHLHGTAPPLDAGYTGWRAVADFDDERIGDRFTETWGCGVRIGLIPVGGGRVYWFVSASGDSQHATDFERRLARWHEPIPDVIAATPRSALSATPILWRKPLRAWGRGNITLLGDAAHPMTPDLGQGAGQALEDAVVLAARVRDAHDVPAGLRAYERERIARTTPIVRRSRQAGRLASASRPVTCALRNRIVATMPARAQERQQRAILDYNLPEL